MVHRAAEAAACRRFSCGVGCRRSGWPVMLRMFVGNPKPRPEVSPQAPAPLKACRRRWRRPPISRICRFGAAVVHIRHSQPPEGIGRPSARATHLPGVEDAAGGCAGRHNEGVLQPARTVEQALILGQEDGPIALGGIARASAAAHHPSSPAVEGMADTLGGLFGDQLCRPAATAPGPGAAYCQCVGANRLWAAGAPGRAACQPIGRPCRASDTAERSLAATAFWLVRRIRSWSLFRAATRAGTRMARVTGTPAPRRGQRAIFSVGGEFEPAPRARGEGRSSTPRR